MSAMEAEHCSKGDSSTPFTTTNYKIRTTPEEEWKIVAQGLQPKEENMVHGRKTRDISKLSHSDSAKRSRLQEYEVIAVVIYTGPMVRTISLLLLYIFHLSDIMETCSSKYTTQYCENTQMKSTKS